MHGTVFRVTRPVRVLQDESPDQTQSCDSTVMSSSKKRVSWNSELEQIFYFEVLPPENENEDEDPTPWKQPDKLADDTNPMPFIQA